MTEKKIPRRTFVKYVAAGSVVVAAGLGGYYFWQSSAPSPSTKPVATATTTSTAAATLAKPKIENKVVWYSAVNRSYMVPIMEAFNKKYPDTEIELYQVAGETLLEKVELEIKAGKVRADLLWLNDPTAATRYATGGYLEKYEPEGVDKLVPAAIGPGKGWYSAFIEPLFFLVNTNVVPKDQYPKSWQDLTDPRWREKVVFADPSVSATGCTIASAMIQNYGYEWWDKMAKNKAVIMPTHPAMVSSVIAGERLVMPAYDTLAFENISKKAPVTVVVPSDGVVLVLGPLIIWKGSEHPVAAKSLADFVFSAEGQKILVSTGFYPGRTDAGAPSGLPSLADMKIMKFDWDWHNQYKAEVKAKVKAMF